MNKYVWLSLDPGRRKIDFYPKSIAARIEKCYNESKNNFPDSCVLGSDYFNSTIHFHSKNSFYQTTPGMSLGRCGFKQPGYRSVLRYPIFDMTKSIIVFGKEVNGEWRITNEMESECKFDEKIPINCIITSDHCHEYTQTYWSPDDLVSNEITKNIIIWEWCRKTNGSILNLDDDYWIPYLYEDNKEIEKSFQKNEQITIKINNSEERKIELNFGSCFGLQKSMDNTKVRNIRRRVINIFELKNIIENITKINCDSQFLENIINYHDIPYEFICCISQEIMTDPVKTVDNHIYDRSSIERWFLSSSKSPLTGLNLTSKELEASNELKDRIQKFAQLKIDKKYNEKKVTLEDLETLNTNNESANESANESDIKSDNE